MMRSVLKIHGIVLKNDSIFWGNGAHRFFRRCAPLQRSTNGLFGARGSRGFLVA